MPQSIWSQDIFSKGELSPLMYSRVTVTAYYNGLKTAANCITYPQGGIGKRFGTLYLNTIAGITSYTEIYFETFQYLNECVYLLVFIPDQILIYLEGLLVATVSSTGIVASEIPYLDSTTLDNRFRISSSAFRPKDLIRTANSANVISGVDTATNTITLTTPVTANLIYPVQFTTSGSLPVTSPQIRVNQTYFIYTTSTTTAEIYTTAIEAKARENAYTITSAGTGTNNCFTLNSWSFTNVTFRNLPVFDFTPAGTYDSINFTPGAVTGYGITLTASSAIFTSAYVGGAFFGNGGIARIVGFTDTTHVTLNIFNPFSSTAAIPGTAALLAEPAWSDARGWPAKCSSFQNRAIFANSAQLPNGVWLSVINDYDDFDGLLGSEDDDAAISWYPSSDNVNVIRFIVPYRSLTIHTNTGIYSTPLSFETAVTPSNFSMTLQDSTPATAIQPRGIDNQIIILSGNDVHSMLWDGFNNSYTSTIASIANEHLIRDPIDEAAYVDLNRAGSRYLFIVNADGSMVIYQTLISEDVSGFTPARLEQSYGNAYFRWVGSSSDGRAWFITERELTSDGDTYDITGYTTDTLSVGASLLLLDGTDFLGLDDENLDLLQNESVFEIGVPSPFTFGATGTLPTSLPQVEAGVFYWAVATEDLDFYVYLTQLDAAEGVNNITFSDAGVDATITTQVLSTTFMIEQLTFDVFTDCSYVYSGTAEDTFTGLPRFNGQVVAIDGDGFGFEYVGQNDTVETKAHGQLVEVEYAAMGFPITTVMQPLQVSPPGQLGAKGSSLVFPQHIRVASFMFNNTLGGFINGTPIQLQTLEQMTPGIPTPPLSGVFEMSFFQGWNNVNKDSITITHSQPFDIRLIGIFYRIES